MNLVMFQQFLMKFIPLKIGFPKNLKKKLILQKKERVNEILKIETQGKISKTYLEEINLIDLIFEFIHGKENLKKDLFIKFRN